MLPVRKNIALKLIGSIMSQQLSVKVANVIYMRFLQLYGGKEPKPQQILDTPPETLRAIGLSNAKVAYVHNVARFVIEEKLTDAKLHKLGNDELITYLTQIKGVGRWTVEMLLMFYLGREDVFACDDLGLQQAMNKLYKLDTTDKKAYRARLIKLSEKWRLTERMPAGTSGPGKTQRRLPDRVCFQPCGILLPVRLDQPDPFCKETCAQYLRHDQRRHGHIHLHTDHIPVFFSKHHFRTPFSTIVYRKVNGNSPTPGTVSGNTSVQFPPRGRSSRR